MMPIRALHASLPLFLYASTVLLVAACSDNEEDDGSSSSGASTSSGSSSGASTSSGSSSSSSGVSSSGALEDAGDAGPTVIRGYLLSAPEPRKVVEGGSYSFEVRLERAPDAPFELAVASDAIEVGTVSPASLRFDADDWASPHVVTVSGVDDDVDDGDRHFRVVFEGPAPGTGSGYDGLAPDPLEMINENDDVAALVVSAPSGTETTEVGGAVTFTVRLASRPLAAVDVPLTSVPATEASVSPASLHFAPEDYATPRTVTVTGLLDDVRDPDTAYQVRIGPASSADVHYQGLQAAPIALTNRERLAAGYVDASINHILSTGQSNAVGEEAMPALSLNQPYSNLMFNTGVMTVTPSTCNNARCTGRTVPTSLVPLVEGDNYYGNDWAGRETLSSGMANQISQLAIQHYFAGTGLNAHHTLVSVHARSGTNYLCLRKAGCNWHPGAMLAFADGMLQVQEGKALAQAAGRSYMVRAVTTVHGEDDHYSPEYLPTATYADALLEWQNDYETSVRAITGQAEPVPLYVMQLSGWRNTKKYSAVSEDQYNAHLRAPGKVILVAPTYMLTYAGSGCLHYTRESQLRMGEYIAKAYAQTTFGGSPWEPLRPAQVTRNGSTLDVRFVVPVAPLQLDVAAVSNPGNYGFEVTAGDGTVLAISSVTLVGADTVRVQLASAPPAGSRLRYAEKADEAACPRPGSRGNLRDSDATPSRSGGAPLYNWAVGFNVAVP